MNARRKKNIKLRLPPRVDAYQRKNGSYAFRFKHWDGHYIKLGTDLDEARQRGHALNSGAVVAGSLAALIEEYWKSPWFIRLKVGTKVDYEQSSKQVVKVLGNMAPNLITPQILARYLRKERASAPIRANREIRGFLSSVYEYGIELGIAKMNPCRQVKRNPEKPRTRKVEWHELESVIVIAKDTGPSAVMMTLIAELCAVAGQRREDVLRLVLPKEDDTVIRVDPLKTKYDEAQVTIELPLTEGLRDIIARARALRNVPIGKKPSALVRGRHLFCNRKGQPYTDSGFKSMWNRLQVKLAEAGGERFTFHDLRGYYVSEAKARGWQVKDTTGHKDEKTADRIYDRRRVRKARPLK